MLSSFISFSQTTTNDITPDKVYTDSSGKTYFSWETDKVKAIAKELETGKIAKEENQVLKQEIVLLHEKQSISDSMNAALNKEDIDSDKIIKNQETIVANQKIIINDNQEIIDNNKKIMAKQESKIKSKNKTIKTLAITNVITIIVIILLVH